MNEPRPQGAGAPAMATCGRPGLSQHAGRDGRLPSQINPLLRARSSSPPSSSDPPLQIKRGTEAGRDRSIHREPHLSHLHLLSLLQTNYYSDDMARLGVAVLALLVALAWLPAPSSAGVAVDFGSGGLESLIVATTVPGGKAKAARCDGAVGECGVDEDEELELGMGDGLLRRSTAQRQPTNRYISYAALKADQVPCNQRGKSYYTNCASQQKANPYRRGCSAITRCQRNTN